MFCPIYRTLFCLIVYIYKKVNRLQHWNVKDRLIHDNYNVLCNNVLVNLIIS